MEDFFNFINSNINADIFKLRLKYKNKISEFDIDSALTQIECRKKHSQKLSKFLTSPKFLFPDNLAAEQCSHQAVASYHASLIGKKSTILDMTSGLGIDSLTFAMNGHDVMAVDINKKRVDTLFYNKELLRLHNLKAVNRDSMELLLTEKSHFDVIFVDPSRRGEQNRRMYNLTDCQPDVLSQYRDIINHCNRLMIKASPLLDISKTIKDFNEITSIHIIGVKGECKEILIDIDKSSFDTKLKKFVAIDLDREGNIISRFEMSLPNEKNDSEIDTIPLAFASNSDIQPGYFLAEPSSMIMKLSPWKTLAFQFPGGLKLDKSSHLFVYKAIPKGFPGRVTRIENILVKHQRDSLKNLPLTVVSRNYPEDSNLLRSKLKVKEGNDHFLYATRIDNKPIMILSSKI